MRVARPLLVSWLLAGLAASASFFPSAQREAAPLPVALPPTPPPAVVDDGAYARLKVLYDERAAGPRPTGPWGRMSCVGPPGPVLLGGGP